MPTSYKSLLKTDVACSQPAWSLPPGCMHHQSSYAAVVSCSGIHRPRACPSMRQGRCLDSRKGCKSLQPVDSASCADPGSNVHEGYMARPTISYAVQIPVPKQPGQPQSLHDLDRQCCLSGTPVRYSSDDQPGCICAGGHSIDVQTEGTRSSEPAQQWDQLQQGCSQIADVHARGAPLDLHSSVHSFGAPALKLHKAGAQ